MVWRFLSKVAIAVLIFALLDCPVGAEEKRLSVDEWFNVVQRAIDADDMFHVAIQTRPSPASDRKTTDRTKRIVDLRREVETWNISEEDRRYLVAALALQEQLAVFYSNGIAMRPRNRSDKRTRTEQMAMLSRLESELATPFVDFRQGIRVGTVGYMCWPKVEVTQVIDGDTFHGYLSDGFRRAFPGSDQRCVFDGFAEAGHAADGEIVTFSQNPIVEVARTYRYQTVLGGTATTKVIAPLYVSKDLPDLIHRVEVSLKNPQAAKKREATAARSRASIGHPPATPD